MSISRRIQKIGADTWYGTCSAAGRTTFSTHIEARTDGEIPCFVRGRHHFAIFAK
ncbi:uncharacterized protein EKO05_0005180 [Ascochyta rabiei]|uniref:uncharacterized protein n=1 Tax=Didymella rabiei TaxID=5454 RepID=UPI00220F99F7|nr:uncharacterized protein EKO05_0005180 [Ascochyta rabiei]UPX14705.1 hypothetical protein EKO05_0005180 [Ascochyta rabiei]